DQISRLCPAEVCLIQLPAPSGVQPVSSAGVWMPESHLRSGIHALQVDRRHSLVASAARVSCFLLACADVVAGPSATSAVIAGCALCCASTTQSVEAPGFRRRGASRATC